MSGRNCLSSSQARKGNEENRYVAVLAKVTFIRRTLETSRTPSTVLPKEVLRDEKGQTGVSRSPKGGDATIRSTTAYAMTTF